MGILTAWLGGRNPDDDEIEDMARANTRPIDSTKIDALVSQLKLAVRDAAKFKSLQAEIAGDASLNAQEIVAIAHRFVGGQKPKSRKAALTAIGQERLRLSHADAKGASAARTKVW